MTDDFSRLRIDRELFVESYNKAKKENVSIEQIINEALSDYIKR